MIALGPLGLLAGAALLSLDTVSQLILAGLLMVGF